jgi:LytTr DNA-binding domain/Bacterial signalling protein N terminal repeat
MHYVGMHGVSGEFAMTHDAAMVVLSVLIAIATAYGGLRAFLARQGGVQLMLSAVAYGFAVSGMHYTAMYGMHLVPPTAGTHHHIEGLAASPQILSLVVSLLCFVIAAGFLLSLVPDPRKRTAVDAAPLVPQAASLAADVSSTEPSAPGPRLRPIPLGGVGQPRQLPAPRLPVEGADGTHFIDTADIRSVRADAHYTKVHDGTRERMCPWSISEAEAQLDPASFIRVHRSHIIALSHVSLMRKEGDGAVVGLDGAVPHLVPVSRAKVAELKAKLGLLRRTVASGPTE